MIIFLVRVVYKGMYTQACARVHTHAQLLPRAGPVAPVVLLLNPSIQEAFACDITIGTFIIFRDTLVEQGVEDERAPAMLRGWFL